MGDRRGDLWARNAKPAAEAAAGLQQGGHCVIVRGRLELTADGMGILDLDGALILLDLVDPIPREFSDTWVELYLQRENVALCPYDV
ncbi:hypothetical protein [Micromonospora coerulea]